MKLSQEDAEEIYHQAYEFYNHGKYVEASEFFQALTCVQPNDYDHWVGLGASKQMQNLHDEAILAYTTASLICDKDPTLFFHIANCSFALHHKKQGLEALNVAETLAANQPEFQGFISQLEILREAWSNRI